MAIKFKEYKNGIYGFKVGKHYIIPNSTNENLFDVIDNKKNIVSEGYLDAEDAQWFVVYHELDDRKRRIFEKLAKLPMWQLGGFVDQCIRHENITGDPDDTPWIFKTVLALQKRKKDCKPEIPGDETSYQKLSMEKEAIS